MRTISEDNLCLVNIVNERIRHCRVRIKPAPVMAAILLILASITSASAALPQARPDQPTKPIPQAVCVDAITVQQYTIDKHGKMHPQGAAIVLFRPCNRG